MLQRGDSPRDSCSGQAEALELLGAGRLFDKPVGYAKRHHPHLRVSGLESLGQVGAKSVDDGALLDRHDDAMLLGERFEHRRIHRLDETAVHHRAVDSVLGQNLGGINRRQYHRAHRQDRGILSTPQLLPGTIRDRRYLGGWTRLVRCLVPGVPGTERAIVRQRGAQ